MSGDHNQFQKDKSYLDQKPRMKRFRWHAKPDGDDLLVCFDYAGKPGDEYVRFVRTGQQSNFECPRCGHCCKADLARVGEVGVWGQCEPQEALEDGWSDWICPKPIGYLMQCCDCDLIHEVDFRVVRYESVGSEVYEVVDDPNLQAQMRLRRRDDLSLKREWQGLTGDEARKFYEKYTDREELIHAIDAFLEEKNNG